MGLSFLFNTAGVAADSIEIPDGATAPGYNPTFIMTGPRSTEWRSTASAGNAIGYAYDEDVAISHVVVARADWLLTKDTMQIQGYQRDSGGTWSFISGFDLAPVVAADLIGPRGQDLVVECSPTDMRGVGIRCNTYGTAEASQISKLYGANAFAFGDADPSFGFVSEPFEPGVYQTPLHGTMPYEVELRFALRFNGVTQDELDDFESTTNLFHWPFFLYDPDQTLWEWRLEHVLLADFRATPITEGRYELNLEFVRLRHYE